MFKKALIHFKRVDPVLYKVALQVESVELVKSEKLFSELCDHVVSQQLSVKAGEAIFGRFKKLFNNEEIVPEELIKMADEDLKKVGLSRSKVVYLKDLTNRIIKGEVKLEELDSLVDEEIILELTKVKGIGRWTGEMFLMSALGEYFEIDPPLSAWS